MSDIDNNDSEIHEDYEDPAPIIEPMKSLYFKTGLEGYSETFTNFEKFIGVVFICLIGLFAYSIFSAATPPMSVEEIIEAEKECRSKGLEPSYFRSSGYDDIRKIVCEEQSRTVYY